MKVVHKNSREEFNLDYVVYTKFFGMYGYLFITPLKEIVFLVSVDNKNMYNMTEEFEILT
jgi:hypothetical protein